MRNPTATFADPFEIRPAEGAALGAELLDRWRAAVRTSRDGRIGAALIGAYFGMGRGDEHDLASTAADVAAYLGHLAEREGLDFAGLCAAAEARGRSSCGPAAAELPIAAALGRALVDLRDYCADTGLSFDDVARIAVGHVRVEVGNAGPGPR
jgi:hypothetical protein